VGKAKWFQLLLRGLEGLLAGLCGLILLERCNQGGTAGAYQWVMRSPRLAMLEVAALILLYGIFRSFFRRPALPFAIYGGLVYFLGMANYFKLFYRNEPLTPQDFFNLPVAVAIAGKMHLSLDLGLIVNLLLVLGCFLLVWLGAKRLYRPLPLHLFWRVALTLGLALSFFAYFTRLPHLQALGAKDIRYNQALNYRLNGFSVSMLMNSSGAQAKKPAGYGRAALDLLRRDIEAAPAPAPLGRPGTKPHIIVLQMEAFADPQLIETRIHYQQDPFAPLAPYETQMRPFGAVASVLGGGTANSEYELLTGYNMYFCLPGVTPFLRYVSKPKPSLARELAAQGYRTIAMHPHVGSFYNRNVVYPNLGFQRFVTQEEFEDPRYVGYYISDEAYSQKIIELYEEEKEGGPLFLFTVSIQNHGPYNYPEIYRPYPLTLEDGLELSQGQIQELETYGANLQDASQALASLLAYFSGLDEPVLLVVYGDHQAGWSWADTLADEPELTLKTYTTQSFFWANYPLEENSRDLISISGLAPEILLRAGLDLSLYNKGIALQFQDIMAYNIAVTVENDGAVDYVRPERVESFRMLQYDRMFGKNYLEQAESP
jgi:phosphoglycerol transferase MdoB-like AlkP superfamily enzyme